MKTGRFSLKELLTHQEVDQIIIPEIQRDYVWSKSNTEKLVDTLLTHYQGQKTLSLEVIYNERPVTEEAIIKHLRKELERFQHHVKLGFVYAYSDPFFPGKFFLIDGQQRLTTLYLFLLACYKVTGREDEFRNTYFYNDILKLDYRVRESSHDFMREFFKLETSAGSMVITDSQYYYREYNEDVTIQNLLSNYRAIREKLLDLDIDGVNGLIEFTEQFVEVNYFDTHLSRQGESLYLYMNSRGEQLSFQEEIKSSLVNKLTETDQEKLRVLKKELGATWEDWQNFFWCKRQKRENADPGFELFLKWGTIIQVCSQNADLRYRFKDDFKKNLQTTAEAKENYIRQLENDEYQQEILRDFQMNHPGFDYDYLQQLHSAMLSVFDDSWQQNFRLLQPGWLAGMMSTWEFIVLIPLLQIVVNGVDDALCRLRFAMFLKNLTYFANTLVKNPDSATRYLVEMAHRLFTDNNGFFDIVGFLGGYYTKNYSSVLTGNEIRKLKMLQLHQLNEKDGGFITRRELEQFFWQITAEEDIAQFLEGNCDILLDCLVSETGKDLSLECLGKKDLELLFSYFDLFKNVFYPNRHNDYIRRILLTFGDYKLFDGGGSWNFEQYLNRYTFIQGDDEWRELFGSDQAPIFIAMMNAFKARSDRGESMEIVDLRGAFVDSYVDRGHFQDPFIIDWKVLSYCASKRILWQTGDRVILLTGKKASTSYKSLQTVLLKRLWTDGQFEDNICFKKFKRNGREMRLEVDYTPKGWRCYITNVDGSAPSGNIEQLLADGWQEVDFKLARTAPFFIDEIATILENVKSAGKRADELIDNISDI